jgi:hypothetical protein
MGPPADVLVFSVHLVPGETPRGGGATVVLVEGPLTEQDDELDLIEGAGAQVQVVIRESTAGKCELLVEASELIPN